jgi:hypothetical protein
VGALVDGGHHEHRGVAVERAVEGEDDLGPVRNCVAGRSALVPLPGGLHGRHAHAVLLGYFGWSDSRMAHRVIPSLAYAIPGAVLLGLGRLAFDAWEARIRRRAERE